jgi:hypothetical protein
VLAVGIFELAKANIPPVEVSKISTIANEVL